MTAASVARATALIRAKGRPIVFRNVVTKAGPNGAVNPAMGAITVAAAPPAGAVTIALKASLGSWFLAAGDQFTLAGDATIYTIGTEVIASAGVFAAVPIAPALAADAADGASVTVTWGADYPVMARTRRYRADEIDGAVVTAKDIEVRMEVTATDGRALPDVTVNDRIILEGTAYHIGIIQPIFSGPDVRAWIIQAKG